MFVGARVVGAWWPAAARSRMEQPRPLTVRQVVDGTPYAELWMGTHPSGPSMIMLTSPWKMVRAHARWSLVVVMVVVVMMMVVG